MVTLDVRIIEIHGKKVGQAARSKATAAARHTSRAVRFRFSVAAFCSLHTRKSLSTTFGIAGRPKYVASVPNVWRCCATKDETVTLPNFFPCIEIMVRKKSVTGIFLSCRFVKFHEAFKRFKYSSILFIV